MGVARLAHRLKLIINRKENVNVRKEHMVITALLVLLQKRGTAQVVHAPMVPPALIAHSVINQKCGKIHNVFALKVLMVITAFLASRQRCGMVQAVFALQALMVQIVSLVNYLKNGMDIVALAPRGRMGITALSVP